MYTLWLRRFDRILSYSAKLCARLKFRNLSKFCSDLRKIGICFGNRPIADFFHDQTIFLKDYELYIIGHSLISMNLRREIIYMYDTNCVPVTMGALSGKVIIAIIAWISVVVILTIVIPIIGIYSERESTSTTLTTTTAESTSDTNNGEGTVLAEFRCFSEGIP